MTRQLSTPLRYPGGKGILTEYFKKYIISNNIITGIYAEPFCGGAGAAISLLLSGSVEKVLLNDANYSIYAFWYSLKNYGERFLELFDNTDINLVEWKRQRAILKNDDEEDIVKKGFATFFLNRCNRSGILTAGPIGGQSIESQDAAKDKIDARFNRSELRVRIEKIINVADQIEVSNLDALTFLKERVETEPYQDAVFVYLDPPYFNQGSSLYLNYYKPEDHKILSTYLRNPNIEYNWILSYDNVSQIRSLYKDLRCYSFYINYSAQQTKLGSELMIFSNNSLISETSVIKKMKSNKTIELVQI